MSWFYKAMTGRLGFEACLQFWLIWLTGAVVAAILFVVPANYDLGPVTKRFRNRTTSLKVSFGIFWVQCNAGADPWGCGQKMGYSRERNRRNLNGPYFSFSCGTD